MGASCMFESVCKFCNKRLTATILLTFAIEAITLFFKESQKSINKTIINDIDSLLPKRKKEIERAD